MVRTKRAGVARWLISRTLQAIFIGWRRGELRWIGPDDKLAWVQTIRMDSTVVASAVGARHAGIGELVLT